MLLSTCLFSLCLFPWWIKGLPNLISIFLSFLDDFGRRCAPGCNPESRDSVIVRVFTTDTICTDWIFVSLVTITTMCNAEYQSKYNLQLLYKFHGRIDYWKCVDVTFDLFIVFCTFLGKYMIPRFSFLKKTFQKGLSIILSIPFL